MKLKGIAVSLFAAAVLSVAPLLVGELGSVDLGSQAYAKGGNGGGNGGGQGNGQANGKGQSNAGGLGAQGRGLGPSGKDGQGHGLGNNRGQVARSLGALNAAHASPTARLHAAPNSRVGLIAAYESVVQEGVSLSTAIGDLSARIEALEAELETLEEGTVAYTEVAAELEQAEAEFGEATSVDLDEQAQAEVAALAEAANKSLSPQVVAEVNSLLGIESAAAEQVDSLVAEDQQPL